MSIRSSLRRLLNPKRYAYSLILFVVSNATADTAYHIEPVADHVYRFTAGHYKSVFMVSGDSAFVTDPINPTAAAWLKNEINERFNAKIRYVAYSHNHYDHSEGGQNFDGEGVTFISHRLAREDMRLTKLDTRLPDIVFDEELTVFFNEQSVHLRYHGANNGWGSVSMLFEPTKTLFVVDWIVLGRLPYRDLQGYDIQGMIASTKEVLEIDFNTIVCGHAASGTKEDVRRYLSYLETLYQSVLEGMLEGKSLQTLQDEIKLQEYSDLLMYEEWLPLNVAGVYRTLNDKSYIDLRLAD